MMKKEDVCNYQMCKRHPLLSKVKIRLWCQTSERLLYEWQQTITRNRCFFFFFYRFVFSLLIFGLRVDTSSTLATVKRTQRTYLWIYIWTDVQDNGGHERNFACHNDISNSIRAPCPLIRYSSSHEKWN